MQFRKEFRGGRSLLTHEDEERELEEMRYKAEMRPSVKLSDVWKHVEDTKPFVYIYIYLVEIRTLVVLCIN